MLMNTTFLEDSFLIKWQSRGGVRSAAAEEGVKEKEQHLCYSRGIPPCIRIGLCYTPTLPLASF